MRVKKILIIEDNFPIENKQDIEEASEVEIELINNYQDAMRKIDSDLSEYDLVITDIGIPKEAPKPQVGSVFNRIWNQKRMTSEELKEDGIKMLDQWKQLGHQDCVEETSVIAFPFERLALCQQWGLFIASTLYEKGVSYIVFTGDVGHSLPALELLKQVNIVAFTETIVELMKAWESSEEELFFRHRLVVGFFKKDKDFQPCKDDPQTWINLIQGLR